MDFSNNSRKSKNEKKLGDVKLNGLSLKRKSLSQSHLENQECVKRIKQNMNTSLQEDPKPYDWNLNSRDSSLPLRNEDIEAALFHSDSDKRKNADCQMSSQCQEPEILILSSDDEEHKNDTSIKKSALCCLKEPCISNVLQMTGKMITTDLIAAVSLVELTCNKIQIGDYTSCDVDDMSLTSEYLKFSICKKMSEKVDVEIPLTGVVKFLWGDIDDVTVLFMYLFEDMAPSVRDYVSKIDNRDICYDPSSTDDTKKRIIFSLQDYGAETQKAMTNLLLMYASPCGGPLYDQIPSKDAMELVKKSAIDRLASKSSDPCGTLLVYPPHPSKGKISISVDDFNCLNGGEFLNDIIIDFYLSWLFHDKLPNLYRQKTHFFSTYFYKRLTAKPKTDRAMKYETDSSIAPAERRHSRVKSWTKNVDIFEKDFIFVPINERCHWFLAVICFPGLDSPVQICDGKPVQFEPTFADLHSRKTKKPDKFMIPSFNEDEWSDRDEADSEEEIDGFSDLHTFGRPPKISQKPALKQPCILIFDSLPVSSRSKIVATLREYLTVEYKERKKKKKVFNKFNMIGAMPHIPQQNNFSDCGVYILQYADSFFENPIKNYRMPILSLKNWFSTKAAANKRESIAKLIKSLMKPSDHDKIPQLTLNVDNLYCQSPPREEPPDNVKVTNESDLCLESGEFQPIESTGSFNSKKIHVNISSKHLKVQPNKSGVATTSGLPSVLKTLADSYRNDQEDDDLYGDLQDTKSPLSQTVTDEKLGSP